MTHTDTPATTQTTTQTATPGTAAARVELVSVRQILTRAGTALGWIEVRGEPTAGPELLAIPVRDRDGRYRGSLSLTHAPSGYGVASDLDRYWLGGERATLAGLRELAAALAALRFDWACTGPAAAPAGCLSGAGCWSSAEAAVRAWRRLAGREDES